MLKPPPPPARRTPGTHYHSGRAPHEKLMELINDPACWCRTCETAALAHLKNGPFHFAARNFIVCPKCGNKRCPRANHHDNACTGSNELGQPGSEWANVLPHAAPPATPTPPAAGEAGELQKEAGSFIWSHEVADNRQTAALLLVKRLTTRLQAAEAAAEAAEARAAGLGKALWEAEHWLTVPPTSNSDRDAVGALVKRIRGLIGPTP